MKTPPAQAQAEEAKGNWLKRNFVSLLMFFAVAGITVAMFIYQKEIARLQNWGYLGAFVISIAANATVVLPMPGLIVLVPMGAAFNPLYIGLAAGVGGAMGEMTAYVAGYSGRGIWQENKWYVRAVAWLKKWGMPVIFLFAVTPLPLDVMGMAAGNLRYPAWKYYTACLPGKIIKYVAMAYAGKEFYASFISSPDFRTCLTAFCVGAGTALIVMALALLLEAWTWKRGKAR
jgi:membrane protein YqaA with SNARE-associated domain